MSVLRKAMETLDLLAAAEGPRRLHEIAEGVGAPRSSVHRLLGELTSLGIVRRVDQGYTLGPRLMYLGAIAAESFDLRVYAEEPMRRLRDLIGESIHLYVIDNGARVCIAAVESHYSLRPFVALGRPLRIGVGSSGKSLLAFTSRARRESVLSELERDDVPYRATREELDRIREVHWCTSVGEREDGVVAASTTVRGADGSVVAVLSVSGPSMRIDRDRLEGFREDLMACAREITARIAS